MALQIILLVLGIGAFVASFLIPEKASKREALEIDPEMIRKVIDKELREAKHRVTEVVDETLTYAVEKTERASERISNEKIMAISEYSDTVLAEVNKAHQEVMFLYDMLNDKHKNIKETAKKVDQQTKEAESKVNVLIERQKENAIKEVAVEKQPDTKKKLQEIAIDASFETIAPKKVETATTMNNKPVEVYSFAKEAPRVERAAVIEQQIHPQSQAMRMEKTVSKTIQEMKQPVEQTNSKKENNNDKILRLYKSGLSCVDIAKELGLGVGEVKLVINLFKGAV